MATLSQLNGTTPVTGNTSSSTNETSNSAFFRKIDQIKTQLLRPSLTSYFQCTIQPPSEVISWLKGRGFNYDRTSGELINISCSDASLPGSSLMTNEITDDYTGVTERHAYRRQYDDRADFTFYVDGTSYNIIWFFDNWVSYISYENRSEPYSIFSDNFSYRIRYPRKYKAHALYIDKFEKDLAGQILRYKFLQAYPISISSMPVSYDSVTILKCTVSFTYTRYVVERLQANSSDLTSTTRTPDVPSDIIPDVPPMEPTGGTQIPGFNQEITYSSNNNYQYNFENNAFNSTNNFSTSSFESSFTQLPQGVGGASGQYTSFFANGQPASSASSQQTTGGVAGIPQTAVTPSSSTGTGSAAAVPSSTLNSVTGGGLPNLNTNVQIPIALSGGGSVVNGASESSNPDVRWGLKPSEEFNTNVQIPIALSGGGSVGDGAPLRDEPLWEMDGDNNPPVRIEPLWDMDDDNAPLRDEPLW